MIYCLSSKFFRNIVYVKLFCKKSDLPAVRLQEPLLSLRDVMGSHFTLQNPRTRKVPENVKKEEAESENNADLLPKDEMIERRVSLAYLHLEARDKRKMYRNSKIQKSTMMTLLTVNTMEKQKSRGSCSELDISFC